MTHLAPSHMLSSASQAHAARAACLRGQLACSREAALPVVVLEPHRPRSPSAQPPESWHNVLDTVMTRLKASVDGMNAPSDLDPAPGGHGVKAGVLECVEALEQLRQAMLLHGTPRAPGHRESAPQRPALREPEAPRPGGAIAGAILSNSSALPPQPEVDLARKEMVDYMAVVAHELRNPLVPIRTAAALLGRVRADEIPRLQRVIERQVTRIAGLIADLVDIARLDSGKLRLQRQVVDMRAIVAEAVEDCRPAMNARSQRLEIDLPAVAIDVDGEPGRLVQIVCNLLDNASKYTPVCGVVGVSLARVGDDLSLVVSDDGIGISAHALPHLFERFAQEARATDFNRAGLGIGLAVVHELVQAHGGRVEARSDGPGRGSRFSVTLPVFAQPTGAAWRVLASTALPDREACAPGSAHGTSIEDIHHALEAT